MHITPFGMMSSKSSEKKKKPVKFRKAPQAPKRGKTAFILFSMAKHPEFRKEYEDGSTDKVPNVAKRVSEAWRNLSPEERAHWQEEARKDKLRYEAEKSMYNGPWKLPSGSKRAKKDPSAPKKPMSAFLAYSKHMRSQVRRDNPGKSNVEISRVLAEKWNNATEDERAVYVEQEEKERARYKVAIEDWRKTRDEEIANERSRREAMAREVVASGAVQVKLNESSIVQGSFDGPANESAPFQNNQFGNYASSQAPNEGNHYSFSSSTEYENNIDTAATYQQHAGNTYCNYHDTRDTNVHNSSEMRSRGLVHSPVNTESTIHHAHSHAMHPEHLFTGSQSANYEKISRASELSPSLEGGSGGLQTSVDTRNYSTYCGPPLREGGDMQPADPQQTYYNSSNSHWANMGQTQSSSTYSRHYSAHSHESFNSELRDTGQYQPFSHNSYPNHEQLAQNAGSDSGDTATWHRNPHGGTFPTSSGLNGYDHYGSAYSASQLIPSSDGDPCMEPQTWTSYQQKQENRRQNCYTASQSHGVLTEDDLVQCQSMDDTVIASNQTQNRLQERTRI